MTENLKVGGLLTLLGSLGVVVTSGFYAAAPAAAALPGPLDAAVALQGAIAGGPLLRAAGTVGIVADVFLAVGALLVAFELLRKGHGPAAAGWTAIAAAAAIFIGVDALGGFVLAPLARSAGGNTAPFEGFKRLFDVLFLLGTLAFGGGTLVALRDLPVSRTVQRLGLAVGIASLAGAVACFAELPLGKLLGLGIAAGAILYAHVGWTLRGLAPSDTKMPVPGVMSITSPRAT